MTLALLAFFVTWVLGFLVGLVIIGLTDWFGATSIDDKEFVISCVIFWPLTVPVISVFILCCRLCNGMINLGQSIRKKIKQS